MHNFPTVITIHPSFRLEVTIKNEKMKNYQQTFRSKPKKIITVIISIEIEIMVTNMKVKIIMQKESKIRKKLGEDKNEF